MAIDSASKRASALNFGFVAPASGIEAADRQAIGWLYNGNLASGTITDTGMVPKVFVLGMPGIMVTHESSRTIIRIGRS